MPGMLPNICTFGAIKSMQKNSFVMGLGGVQALSSFKSLATVGHKPVAAESLMRLMTAVLSSKNTVDVMLPGESACSVAKKSQKEAREGYMRRVLGDGGWCGCYETVGGV